MKLLKFLQSSDEEQRAERYRKLIHKEAKIGGELFGPVPAGHRREFFCLDEHTWVWHEEWESENGQRQVVMTRYDVRPNGVLKVQGSQPYQQLSLGEALNLYQAMGLYEQKVTDFYRQQFQAV